MVYFSADPHFFHDRIIDYCNRPFKNSEEMNQAIIRNFNYYLQPQDVVYWLGDMGLATPDQLKSILSQIKGIHILILGNHDKHGINTYYKVGFSAVLNSAEIRIGKSQVTLAHYPRRTFWEFVRIARLYFMKMCNKQRSFKHILAILRREWLQYKPFSKNWHICGHVHEKWAIRGKNINVGVDVRHFKPVSINEISGIIDKFTIK